MIVNLFSLPIYKVNLADSGIDFESIKSMLDPVFENSKYNNADLEKQGGISTYWTDCHLHNRPELDGLSQLILEYTKLYWKVLDISDNLHPSIHECWSNRHTENSFTACHSHSHFPIVATFYLEAPKNSGDIVLINPMEYGLTHMPYNSPIETKTETAVHIQTGDLILFPGWLRHRTQENKSGHQRTVLSFNIKYTGKYMHTQDEYPDMHANSTSEIDNLTNQILRQQMIINALSKVQR